MIRTIVVSEKMSGHHVAASTCAPTPTFDGNAALGQASWKEIRPNKGENVAAHPVAASVIHRRFMRIGTHSGMLILSVSCAGTAILAGRDSI